ncbi:DUF2785 domain-containing protein [Fictibacillus iocasae]|uniref:DUF2785 domain-containing protein n=1 Tax=Fictibacillus iocasae TaxID=2715437 RepID=A0ABW2NSQ2_9BACL
MLTEATRLKERLQDLGGNLVQKEEAFELALEMMQHIGDTDPDLRDKLIYTKMFHMIKAQLFTNSELEHLLILSVDDQHLFFRLGEEGTDSVFTRTFSVLITALVLNRHNENPFLSDAVFQEVKSRVFQYARRERDIRGYVEHQGWAHSVAHMADCLDELALNEAAGKDDLTEILHIAQQKMMESRLVFDTEEDERMATAVVMVLKRGLHSYEELIAWLESWSDYKKTEDYNENFTVKINAKHFLRCLYFRLNGVSSGVTREDIENVLVKL